MVLVIHVTDQGCFQNRLLTQEPKQKKGKKHFSPHNLKKSKKIKIKVSHLFQKQLNKKSQSNRKEGTNSAR